MKKIFKNAGVLACLAILFLFVSQLSAPWVYNPFTRKLDYYSMNVGGALTGEAAGDILFHDGTNWTNLTAGANGLVLTLNAGLPTWIAAGAPGAHAASHELLGADLVDHDNLTNFAAAEHLLVGAIDHDSLLNYVAGDHIGLPATIATVLTDHNLAAHTALGLNDMANVFYVSATGGDNSIFDWYAGAEDASVTINLQEGEEWREALTVGESGSATYPIIIRSYGSGADPIVNGANIISGDWGKEGALFTSYFEGDTEGVNPADFDSVSESNGTIQSKAAAKYSGDMGMRGTVTAGSGYAYAVQAFVHDPNLSIKFRFRFNNVATPTADRKNLVLRLNEEGGERARLRFEVSSVPAYWFVVQARDDGNSWYTSGDMALMSVNTWYLVEYEYFTATNPGDNDGYARARIDGGAWTSVTALDNDDKGDIDGIHMGFTSQHAEIDAGDIDFDEVEVYQTGSGTVNAWEHALATEPNSGVFFDTIIGTKESAVANLTAAREWYWTGSKLYVYSTSNPDTAYTSPGIEAAQRNYSINIDGKSYITVDGLTIKYANLSGIHIGGVSTNFTLQNSLITYNHNNGLWGDDAGEDRSGLLVDTNTISYNGGMGIAWNEDFTSGTIENNTINNNGIDATQTPNLGGIKSYGDDGSGLIIQNNTVHTNTNFGIWMDTQGSSGSIIRYNLIYAHPQCGIFIEKCDGNQVYYNLLYANQTAVDAFDGGEISVVAQGGGENANSNLIYNNVCYNGNNWGLQLRTADDAGATQVNNNLFKNNIVVDCANGNVYTDAVSGNDATNSSGNVFSNNCFDAESANFITWAGVQYSTYDTWEVAYGGTTNSVESDPLMIDAANEDFRLLMGSPCVNKGTDVSLTRDYRGRSIRHAPDIGAYEDPTNVLFMTKLFNHIMDKRRENERN